MRSFLYIIILMVIHLNIFSQDILPGIRDPWLWPFSQNSIWNQPIGSDAIYVDVNLESAKYATIDIQHILELSTDFPERQVFGTEVWGPGRCDGTTYLGFTLRVPDDWVVPDAINDNITPNNNFAFRVPNSDLVFEGSLVSRCVPAGPVYLPSWMSSPSNRKYQSITENGLNGAGQGASGMSALGGTIRKGEFSGVDPIRHAIKINPWAAKYCYYHDTLPGYKWPAKSADNYAAEIYKGNDPNIVMGSLFAIPPQITSESIGINTLPGKKLFFTLQNYGVYFTEDGAGDYWSIIVERDVDKEFENEFGFSMSSETWKNELNKLMTALHAIKNNSPNQIGGGGMPLQPLAPGFFNLVNHYIADTICQGDYVEIGDSVFTQSGKYTICFKNKFECDSIVNLELTVIPTYKVTEYLSIDESELPYDFFGQIIPLGTTSGKIDLSFTSVSGCDSIVVLNLTINSINETKDSVIKINLGESPGLDGWNKFEPNKAVISNVEYSNGVISPYNFSIWADRAFSSKGDSSGNCFHEDVIENCVNTTDNQIRYFTLSNLDEKKVYDIDILSSRSSYAWGERGAYFSIGTLKDSINAKGNTCKLASFTNIQCSEGQIKIGYRKRISDIEGYVNAIIITERNYTSNSKPTLEEQQIEILNNLVVGSSIATLEASDPDGNDVQYTIIEGNEKGWFLLDENTGVLSINKTINISSNQEENLLIQATDNSINPLSTIANISIQITFIKESQANNKPIIVLNFNESVIGGTINNLNASNSFDLDEENLSYNWIVPEGINISSHKEANIAYLAPDVSVPTTKNIIVEVSDGIDISYKNFDITPTPFKPKIQMVKVASINASNYENDNHPIKVLDKDPNSYWSAYGDNNWITLELSHMVDVSHLKISFYGMEDKKSRIDILFSIDNQNWETIYEDLNSCGFSNKMHLIDCSNVRKTSTSYKYIKLLGHGTDKDEFNSIAELEVYGSIISTTTDIDNKMEQIRIYPNPAFQYFVIELQEKSIINLYDLSGKIVFQKHYDKGRQTVPINLPKGCYIISLQLENNVNIQKKLIIN